VKLPAPTFPEIADPKQRAYLVAYARTGKFLAAAAAAGVSIRTEYNWRHDPDDVAFRKAFAIAQELAGDRAEDELHRWVFEGIEQPVYQGGQLVGTELHLSPQLLMFMLKATRPHKYREHVEHSGPKGGPIPIGHTGTVTLYLPQNFRGARS